VDNVPLGQASHQALVYTLLLSEVEARHLAQKRCFFLKSASMRLFQASTDAVAGQFYMSALNFADTG